MPLSLHAATIPSYLQLIDAAKGWIDKADDSVLSEEQACTACLIDDMLPFCYQIKSMAVHSMGAIEGVRAGTFSPDMSEPPQTLAGLRTRLEEARHFLESVSEEEMEGFFGRDMLFEIPKLDIRLDFTAEQFLLSFSQPNFYFHATTAYAILRHKGVQVGKRDYLGAMRIKH